MNSKTEASPSRASQKRKIHVLIYTDDGDLLDFAVIETDAQYFAVRPVDYSMPGRAGEEVLNAGRPS